MNTLTRIIAVIIPIQIKKTILPFDILNIFITEKDVILNINTNLQMIICLTH